jgi:hypothetical protein
MTESNSNNSDDSQPENQLNENQSEESSQETLIINLEPDGINTPKPGARAKEKNRPKNRTRSQKNRPGQSSAPTTDETDGAQPSGGKEPKEPKPQQNFQVGREGNKNGYLIGIGGTGTSIVDLAIWSDHLENEVQDDRRRSFKKLIPPQLRLLNLDLSHELNEKFENNPGLSGHSPHRYDVIMNTGEGAGRVPPIGRMVGELMYETITRTLGATGQVAIVAHSHSGGTGSGLAPTVARLLTAGEEAVKQFKLPDNVNPRIVTGPTDEHRSPMSHVISVGLTESDNYVENRIYNFKNIVDSFSLSIIVDVDTIAGKSKRGFNDLTHGLTKNRPSRRETLDFYREQTVLPSFGGEDDNRPDFDSQGGGDGYKYAVADRYAARIIRMLGSFLKGRNFADLINAARSGQRFSNPNGAATWALPYIWPPDGDIDPEIADSSLGYAICRALVDGSLCNSGSEFKSAESVIVFYECHEDYMKTVDYDSAYETISLMLGINRDKVTIERVPSITPFKETGVSVLVLAIGQVPGFTEDWINEYNSEEKVNEVNSSVSKKWIVGAPDRKPFWLDDEGDPLESHDVLPDRLQTGQWRHLRDKIEQDLQVQMAMKRDSDAPEDIAGRQLLRDHLTGKVDSLVKDLETTKIWEDFKKFADITGITAFTESGEANDLPQP